MESLAHLSMPLTIVGVDCVAYKECWLWLPSRDFEADSVWRDEFRSQAESETGVSGPSSHGPDLSTGRATGFCLLLRLSQSSLICYRLAPRV